MRRTFFCILHGVKAAAQYLKWTVSFGATPAILNVVLAYMVRSEGASLHASIGIMSGCILNIILDPVFTLPWGLNLNNFTSSFGADAVAAMGIS